MRSFYQLQVTFFAHTTLLVKTFNFCSMPQPLTFVPAADSDLASVSNLLTATVLLPHYCLPTTFFHEISIKISYLGCDYMSSGTQTLILWMNVFTKLYGGTSHNTVIIFTVIKQSNLRNILYYFHNVAKE